MSQQAGGLSPIDTDTLHVEQEVLIALEVGARAELVTVLPLVVDDLPVRLELSGAPGWRQGGLQLEGEWRHENGLATCVVGGVSLGAGVVAHSLVLEGEDTVVSLDRLAL